MDNKIPDTDTKPLAVYVMTHGPECPYLADYCIPLEIGAAVRDKHCCSLRDDLGEDNISAKDRLYCEITGLYWMWKNDKHDYIGLYHYRRIFHLSEKKILKLLSKYDIIMPEMIRITPTIDTESGKNKIQLDWDITKEILREKYPEYYETAQSLFTMNKSYAYNMFITSKKIFNEYCSWLFPLLFEIEEELLKHDSERKAYVEEQAGIADSLYLKGYRERAIGFIAERMIHLYIAHNNLKAKDIPLWFVPPYVQYYEGVPKIILKIANSNIYIARAGAWAINTIFKAKNGCSNLL